MRRTATALNNRHCLKYSCWSSSWQCVTTTFCNLLRRFLVFYHYRDSFVRRTRSRRAGWTVGSCEISSGAFQINRCLLLCIATFMLSCSLSISLSIGGSTTMLRFCLCNVQCAPSYVPIWMKRRVGREKNMQIKRKSVWLEICIYFQMFSSHIHRLICMFPTHDKS